MKTSLIIDLAGNLQSRARQYTQALNGMAEGGGRALGALGKSAGLIGRGLDKLGNRYTALLTGVGAAGTVKDMMTLQERMTRLGITADVSQDKVNELNRKIYETAQSPDIRINPDGILSAVESILEKTGDLKFAEANIRNIGLAIQASGADGAAIGDIFAEFQKQGMNDTEALAAVDTLIAQGKAGAFTLKDLASLGPRVVTAYTALGRQGPQAMKEMGAVLQLIRMGTGSSEQAATAWEAMLRVFSDKSKVEFLQKQGIRVFDEKGSLRAANELMVDILKAAGNDAKNLSDVFDSEAIRAFNATLAELKRTGGVETLNSLMSIEGDGSTVLNDSARAAQTANAALTNLHTAWTRFADSKLTEPIQKAADLLNRLGSEQTQQALDGISKVAMAVGGLVLARKGYNAVQGVRGFFGKKGEAGPNAAGGFGGLSLPLPVYVVNDRMSLTNEALSDMTGGTAGGTGRDGKTNSRARQAGKGGGSDRNGGKGGGAARTGGAMASRGGRFMPRALSGVRGGARLVGRAVPMATTVLAVTDVAGVLADSQASLEDKVEGVSEAVGSAGGGAAGAWAGAAAGAAIGSVVPVIGTAVGGVLGAILGGWLGSEAGGGLGRMVGENITGRDQARAIGEEMAARQGDLARDLASRSEVSITVNGPAVATLANREGPMDITMLYAGMSMAGGGMY